MRTQPVIYPQDFPKVSKNLRERNPFKISLETSTLKELVLIWDDNSCFILHFDDEDMKALRKFVQQDAQVPHGQS